MKLPISYLQPGMILQSSVYGSMGRLLLSAGISLTNEYINALKRVGVLAVHVRGLIDLDEEEACEVLNDEIKVEALTAVQTFVKRNMTVKDYKALAEVVETIVTEVLSGKIPVGGLAEISAYDSYTYTHSVDVCALAVAIGHYLGLSKGQLMKLGMGAILHDLGKTQVSATILNKPGKLTEDEFEEMKKHPRLGYEMLRCRSEGMLDYQTAAILINHHERFDGSGYPRRLTGRDLSSLDMACAVADVYCAMTTDRVYKKAAPYAEAYEMLLGCADSLFPIDVIRAFSKCVEPYPVGTFVQMSNGQTAYVVKSNPALPTRPMVKLLATGEILDLNKNLSLVISSQLPSQQISRLISERQNKLH